MIMGFSLRIMWRWSYRRYHEIKNRLFNKTNSIPWHHNFRKLNQLWVDSFSNPNEKAYDIWEAKKLVESANLEVVDMLSLGKIRKNDLPKNWLPLFEKLDNWSQYRIMELFYPEVGSVNLIARKKLKTL